MPDEIIETLYADRGLKYDETGEVIASYNRCIVFLPKGAEPGKEVRVILREILGKTDRRGHPMYQSEPASVEYSESWKDNGDGTASRVKIAIDWLFLESEVEVLETRKLETKDETSTSRWEWEARWGADLTSTQLVRTMVQDIPILQETVDSDGILSFQKTGQREERESGEVLEFLEPPQVADLSNRFAVSYDSEWRVKLVFKYRDVSGNEDHYIESATWGQLPNWLQSKYLGQYPVCGCGRQRRDVQVFDGYSRCELCREDHEHCERCGRQKKVLVINGHLICEDCRPYVEQEQLIAKFLEKKHRKKISDEAKSLLSVRELDSDTGLLVLKVGLGHIESSSMQDRILRGWSGYRWYYFTEGGIFGTKLDPAALQILQFLSQATGNSLVELVAWIAGGPKSPSSDFYLQTQVEGEGGVKPSLTEDRLKQVVAKLEEEKPVLADWLRGSEDQRLAALEAFRKVEADLWFDGQDSSVINLLWEAKQTLQGEEQDYNLVLTKIAEAYAEKAKRQVLDELLTKEYSSCPICGGEVNVENFNDTHWCSGEKQEELRARGQYQDFLVKVSKVGDTGVVKLVAVYSDRHDEYELHLEADDSAQISDPSEIATKTFWRKPSAQARELAEENANLRSRLDFITSERSYAGRVEGTFQAVEREGKTHLQFEGTFSGSVANRKGEGGYSSYEKQAAIFVCRSETPWLDESPKVGETWICTTAFLIGVSQGRPVIVVNPQVRSDQEDVLQQKMVQLAKKLKAEQEIVSNLVEEPFDEEGNPSTAMADALRRAGIVPPEE